jgi:hypothetical protein
MEEFYLLTFNNVSEAMQCEKLLIEKAIKILIVPTPTVLTKSCGLSAKIRKEDEKEIIRLINNKELKLKDIYIRRNMNFLKLELREISEL